MFYIFVHVQILWSDKNSSLSHGNKKKMFGPNVLCFWWLKNAKILTTFYVKFTLLGNCFLFNLNKHIGKNKYIYIYIQYFYVTKISKGYANFFLIIWTCLLKKYHVIDVGKINEITSNLTMDHYYCYCGFVMWH